MNKQPPSLAAKSSQPITLRQQMIDYLDHLETINRSARTLESYQERLLPFVQWCELRGVMRAVQVTVSVLEGYQRYLVSYRRTNGKHLTVQSQLQRLSAIKVWFDWLLKQHALLYNPAHQLTLPKAEYRLPAQVFNEAETLTILDAIDTRSAIGLRNRTVLEVLWSTGIRRMELSRLMLSDLDNTRQVVRVNQGKGKKDRLVPIGERALHWIARYLTYSRPELTRQSDSGHLFVSNKGKALSLSTLTQLAGKAIREEAHANKPGACHVFRHSMATQMLENGADTREIQAILGHEKLETTQVYTRVAIGHLQKVHAKTHPAEKKRPSKQRAANQPKPE